MNNYNQNYYRRYLVKQCSCQHLFYIFLWYLIIALPFYFSFGGQKFWLKTKEQMMTVNYNYTGYYAIQINSILSNNLVQQQQSNIIGYPTTNFPTSPWTITVNDQLNSTQIVLSQSNFASAKQIIDVNLIFYFQIYITQLGKETSVAYIENCQGDFTYFQKQGLVTYQPQKSLNNLNNFGKLNYPAYYPNLQSPNSFQSLIDHVINNDEVHRLNIDSTSIKTIGKGQALRTYKFNLSKDTSLTIPYYPSILETLKFSFLTWFAFVIIAFYIFYILMEKLVKDGGISTKMVDQQIK